MDAYFAMGQGNVINSAKLPTGLHLDGILNASEVAVWHYYPHSGTLICSDTLYQLLPDLAPLKHRDQLLALLSAADQYIFQNTFKTPESVDLAVGARPLAACEVRLTALASKPSLRFIARANSMEKLSKRADELCYSGVVVSGDHWLANPGPEYIQKLLSRLFSESPIASLVTDCNGVVLECNQALETLLRLTPRQATSGFGQYNLLRDQNFKMGADLRARLEDAYRHGDVVSFELEYRLKALHKNRLMSEQSLPLKASFLPLKDRRGNVARVLVQLQEYSRSIAPRLDDKDEVLYSLINNSHSMISVKSPQGTYLLANRSFADWLGREEDEVCGSTDADLFPAPVAARLQWEDRGVCDGHITSQSEEVFPAADGQEQSFLCARFPVFTPGGALQGVGQVMTDISEQKAIEQRLQAQTQELRLLLDSMRSAVWYLDRWGLVKDYNRLAKELFPDSVMEGKGFLELAGLWDDAAERQREIMQVIRTGEAQLESIETAHFRTGQRWFSVDKIPTKDRRGRVTGLLLVMTDITQQQARERELARSDARYKAFIANSSEAIWCYDIDPPIPTDAPVAEQSEALAANARLSEGNQVLARMLGVPSISDVLGSGLRDTGSKNYLFDGQLFIDQGYRLVDHRVSRRDHMGREICVQISCRGAIEDGCLTRVWGTTKDVTARKRYEDRLEYQANHDALTHLPNRSKLYREVERWLAQRSDRQLGALLIIDLDRFKEINDTLGHQVGDYLLRLIGPRLESEMADIPGVVARLGGDEFAVFMPEVANSRQALVFGHRVLDALRNEFDVDGYSIEISASIGISVCPTQARDVSTMMRYADVAMYQAKTEMCGAALYDPEKDPHSPKRLSMMVELRKAIRDDQLSLYYQPKIDLQERRCYGFEALLRWNHPELGFVSPGEFIPIVEMTNLIHPMTHWVLEQSIRQCRQWHDQGLSVSVAVNLSARNLMDETMPRQVEKLLEQYQLPASALELEITESSIMNDPARAMKVLEWLHELGVSLSIDDFGTGYSSLAYLKRLPVQTLKIDYSFVRHMLDDEQDEIIVNSTIQLAHNLGLSVVAEGVECEELLERLSAMGCDRAQGYHIARPLAPDQLQQWIDSAPWMQCR
ncbi:GGDEF domain-containing phosphodiesterase [Marinimicrobium sp. ABcell2]|uniref:bifunctional diguanylate cyclase/phosphodiesterase n=1 Tax=Marinimicrobium sp. ABcell2 TaxID=3069751 RepID=UPI0027B415A8|nr:GGDEF domain-containing phosphodiesterase [Marinimicrobium sp. ABcell2]MDQ2075347.1 EAL domain-containing protein [Marinimicrobium sp. ABcell2]